MSKCQLRLNAPQQKNCYSITSSARPESGYVKAQMFYLTRRAGWKETQVIENKGVDYDRMSEEELIRSIAERANKLGVKIDVNIGERHPHALDRNQRSKRQRRG